MRYCENCGNVMADAARCCSRCGKPAPGAESGPRDYWAERLGENQSRQPQAQPAQAKIQPPEPAERRITMVEQTHPGTRKKWPWILCLLGALALMAGGLLLARPLLQKDRTPCRLYEGRLCSQREVSYPGDGDWVKLYADGNAELCLLGLEETGTWTSQEGHLLLVLPDRILEGREEAGCLLLTQEDMQFLLAVPGTVTLPELTEPAPAPRFRLWTGDCYGWWTVTEAWGKWEENAGTRFDICGRFRMEEEDQGKLELWDTACGPGELFCAADFTVEPGLTEAGCLRSGKGLFCGVPMEPGAWNVDPGRPAYEKLEGLTVLTGTCSQGSSGFSYMVYLGPWGMAWDGVKKMPSGLLPEKNRLPEGYTQWYMPKIAAGETMPGSF